MSQFSYESIEDLASDVQQSDGYLDVTFECPLSGERVRASAPLDPDEARGSQSTEPFQYRMVRSVNSLVRDILGYNAAFDAATTAVDSKLDQAGGSNDESAGTSGNSEELTEEKEKDAIFRAFQSVMHRFAWDSANDRWVAIHETRGLGNELQRQLKLAPIESGRDRKILERMLIDIASADDEVTEAERDILLNFIDREELRKGRTAASQRLSQADLRQTTEGPTRETLFMLALVVALADEEFDMEESDRIEFYAKGLGIGEMREEELLDAAQRFFVEQYLVRRFAQTEELDEEARDDLVALAERIDFDVDAAELAFERYKQAHENQGGSDDGGGFSMGPQW